MTTVVDRLLRAHRARRAAAQPYLFSPDVFVGMETRTVPREYYWDGLARGGDARRPDVLFQYTLRGWGNYADAGATPQRLDRGDGFLAILPSAHAYWLPPESPEWTFFWITVRHPYVVSRLAQLRTRGGLPAVVHVDERHVLLATAVKLFEGVGLGTFRDDFAREAAVFEFLVEVERFAHDLKYSRPERERLLAETRDHVIANLDRPVEVAELAERRGMSRSHFTHHFARTTGLSPGKFVAEIRLKEVSRRLVGAHDTLKTIAADTGFADANHLCKVFRRHYHLSPGAFRKQMR